MPTKLGQNRFACSFCGKVFDNTAEHSADGTPPLVASSMCESGHHPVFFPLTKEELSKLISFIYTGEERLISPEFYERLLRFNNSRTASEY